MSDDAMHVYALIMGWTVEGCACSQCQQIQRAAQAWALEQQALVDHIARTMDAEMKQDPKPVKS